MTDPKRPDDTDEVEAVDDESAGATSDEELEADEDFDDEFDDDDSETDELETKELPRATAAAPGGQASGARPTVSSGAKQASIGTAAAPVDELPYVDDRVSKIWVGLIAAVFAVIFIYGLLLGRGGMLTTSPSPEPSPSRPPSASPGTIVSPSVRPSVTIRPSGSPLPPASASPSGAPSPTAPPSAVPEPT